jgi:murein tripeptide amidase MpaA
MPDIRFDTYHRYDGLTNILKAFADENPNFVKLDSIGKSYEGRDIWLATVTNFDTGPADEKPALWVDGNIHASEVSPSSACLYLINTLVNDYGSSEDIKRCLDTRVFYICPRINPDGAEWALADVPKIIRSSTRPYPYDEDPIEGLKQEDVDGDGRMLMMRIEDPNGQWKAHSDEARLMVRRDPTETGGTYYRVLSEGMIDNYDGHLISIQPTKEGLDMNRNFPIEWRQDHVQPGAGPYPTSEPEVHAIVDFVARHRNITGGISFHTWSGVLLRPYGDRDDKEFPAEDLWTFEKIGDKGTEITGYPNISVYHDFRYHPKQVITGVFDDWLYDHLGMFGWTVEIWSPQQQAGIEDFKFIEWYREHPIEDDFKMLKWNDEQLDGQGYVDWYEFEHPQLGKVELGGWNTMYAFRNPPPKFLEKEISTFPDWLVWHLLISPELELIEAKAVPISDNTYRVELVVHNTGWLPTYVTKMALEKKISRGVICEIALPDGATLESGKVREEGSHLEGRAYASSVLTPWATFGPLGSTADRLKMTWTVHAPNGGSAKLTARHDRAGVVRTEVELSP